MVKELILDNDRVVLPGLGSFVAEIVPSTFSDKGYTINPPYRRLYFRSRPDEGNELVEFYAAGNNLELSVAERIIKDYVAELKSVLHVKKAVVFPGLGRLRATKENNLFFVADEDLDIYPAGFGLEPVSLKTHQETKEEVTAAVEELKSMLPEIPVRKTEPEPETVQVMPETEAVPDKELEEDVPAVPSIEESVPEIEAEVSVTEEPVPEIAQTSNVQVLDNYEITLPEEQKAIEVSQNMNVQNIEKAPMFVTDMPIEQPTVQPVQSQPVAIDVPEVEEIQ